MLSAPAPTVATGAAAPWSLRVHRAGRGSPTAAPQQHGADPEDAKRRDRAELQPGGKPDHAASAASGDQASHQGRSAAGRAGGDQAKGG
jgi:hypothetical protein